MEYGKYVERITSEREVLDAFVQASCEALERYDVKPLTDIGVLAVAQAQIELLSLAGKELVINFGLLKNVVYTIATAPELGNPFNSIRDVNCWLMRATHNGWIESLRVSPLAHEKLASELQSRSSAT